MKNIGAEKQLSEYNHVYKENTAIYRDLSIRLGLNESTFWILYTLRIEESPVTQSDMCAILAYPKQTVNSALKKLEQEGLLTLFGERVRVSQALSLVMVLVSAFMLFYNLKLHPHKPEELYVNIVAAREAEKAEEKDKASEE